MPRFKMHENFIRAMAAGKKTKAKAIEVEVLSASNGAARLAFVIRDKPVKGKELARLETDYVGCGNYATLAELDQAFKINVSSLP